MSVGGGSGASPREEACEICHALASMPDCMSSIGAKVVVGVEKSQKDAPNRPADRRKRFKTGESAAFRRLCLRLSPDPAPASACVRASDFSYQHWPPKLVLTGHQIGRQPGAANFGQENDVFCSGCWLVVEVGPALVRKPV